jgi:hypothetical protein
MKRRVRKHDTHGISFATVEKRILFRWVPDSSLEGLQWLRIQISKG